MGGLTPKQTLFVAEFGKDWNATQAAKRAGYSEKTARQIGSENLSKPAVCAAIKKVHDQRRNDAVMSAQETLERLTTIGRTDVAAFHDKDGNPIPVSAWTPEMGQQVQKIEVVRKNVAAGDGHTDTVLKISAWDKIRALEQLARHHGLVNQRVDINVVTSAELQAGRDRVAVAAELRKASEAKLATRERHVLEGELIDSST